MYYHCYKISFSLNEYDSVTYRFLLAKDIDQAMEIFRKHHGNIQIKSVELINDYVLYDYESFD